MSDTTFGIFMYVRNHLWNAVETGFFPSPHNNLLPHNEDIIKNRSASKKKTYLADIRKSLALKKKTPKGVRKKAEKPMDAQISF